MATLTETAAATKKILIGLVITMITLIIGRMALSMGLQIYKQLNPPPPPKPTLGFGVTLPPTLFPKKDIPNLTFKLETVGNVIPTFGDSGGNARVFPITFGQSGFLDLDRAKQQAAALGFVLEPEFIEGTQYRWSKTAPLSATLDLDSIKNRFTLSVAWETDPGFLNNRATPTQEQAVTEAKQYLQRAQFLPDDLSKGEGKATFLKYAGGRFTKTLSLSEADFVQVELYRQALENDQGFWTSDPFKGVASVLVSSAREQGKRIVKVDYKYTNVLYDQAHTYPVVTGAEAWNMVVNKRAYIASPPSVGTTAVVRKISFGYYDSLDQQKLMQPIYVFEGDNDFVAYVPAIRPEFIQNPTPVNP